MLQEPTRSTPSKVISIAGSDSGGGAGIQADIKTFAALGCYGTTVVTAVTAQNTRGVFAIAEVPEEVIIAQIDSVLEDIGTDAAKTGMLSSASIIGNVADRLEAWGIANLVVDPVMVAKSGDHLLHASAIESLKRELLPMALVVTPNIPEAEVLSGHEIRSDDDARSAAQKIFQLGPQWVVIKGGHRRDDPVDLVFDGSDFTEIKAPRVETENTHGTGCTFSAAIASYLARDAEPLEAIRLAKDFITEALAASYPVGEGHSPVNHFHAWTGDPGGVAIGRVTRS
jgi:hydroxymethylpyrimidine/phosphomethylpyrimidine kinase